MKGRSERLSVYLLMTYFHDLDEQSWDSSPGPEVWNLIWFSQDRMTPLGCLKLHFPKEVARGFLDPGLLVSSGLTLLMNSTELLLGSVYPQCLQKLPF